VLNGVPMEKHLPAHPSLGPSFLVVGQTATVSAFNFPCFERRDTQVTLVRIMCAFISLRPCVVRARTFIATSQHGVWRRPV
jgi:hypothetical protein